MCATEQNRSATAETQVRHMPRSRRVFQHQHREHPTRFPIFTPMRTLSAAILGCLAFSRTVLAVQTPFSILQTSLQPLPPQQTPFHPRIPVLYLHCVLFHPLFPDHIVRIKKAKEFCDTTVRLATSESLSRSQLLKEKVQRVHRIH